MPAPNWMLNCFYKNVKDTPNKGVPEKLSTKLVRWFEDTPDGRLYKSDFYNKDKRLKSGQLTVAITELLEEGVIVFDPETQALNKILHAQKRGKEAKTCYILKSRLNQQE